MRSRELRDGFELEQTHGKRRMASHSAKELNYTEVLVTPRKDVRYTRATRRQLI
jgi:beta-xylosidase